MSPLHLTAEGCPVRAENMRSLTKARIIDDGVIAHVGSLERPKLTSRPSDGQVLALWALLEKELAADKWDEEGAGQ